MSRENLLQVNFRMPIPLKERLERAAVKSNRTLTAEIVERLTRSFDDEGEGQTKEMVKAFAQEVVEELRKAGIAASLTKK